jgi:hypothetical protein
LTAEFKQTKGNAGTMHHCPECSQTLTYNETPSGRLLTDATGAENGDATSMDNRTYTEKKEGSIDAWKGIKSDINMSVAPREVQKNLGIATIALELHLIRILMEDMRSYGWPQTNKPETGPE